MKILLVSVIFPYPIDAGGSAGSFKLIDYSRKFNEITLVCPHPSREEYYTELKALWPDINIVTFHTHFGNGQPTLLRKVYNFMKGRGTEPAFEEISKKNMVLFNTDLVNCHFPGLISTVKKLIAAEQFELIQVEFIEFAPIVYFLPEHTPKVFIHHEIRHRRMKHELDTLSHQSDVLKWRLESTKKLEISILSVYNNVFTLSDQDKEYLVEDGIEESKISVSPLPVEFKKSAINQPFVFKNRIIYLGPEQHYPNLDAVDWFLQHCWDEISRKNPKIQFWVVGKWSEQFKAKHGHQKNVIFKGFVQHLEEVMEGSVMIVPLRIVSGMRMKILEAASWNVPVVTTTLGAEGLPMVHNENCLIADSPDQFVREVERAITDSGLQQKLIKNSEELISEKFSKEYCGEIREQYYSDIMQNH